MLLKRSVPLCYIFQIVGHFGTSRVQDVSRAEYSHERSENLSTVEHYRRRQDAQDTTTVSTVFRTWHSTISTTLEYRHSWQYCSHRTKTWTNIIRVLATGELVECLPYMLSVSNHCRQRSFGKLAREKQKIFPNDVTVASNKLNNKKERKTANNGLQYFGPTAGFTFLYVIVLIYKSNNFKYSSVCFLFIGRWIFRCHLLKYT